MKIGPTLAALLSMLLLASCRLPSAPRAKEVVRIAVLPAYSLEVMASKYVPLTEYLAEETGYKVEYVASLGYSDYLGVVETSRVQFGLQNAYVYQILRKTRGAYPVAQVVGSGGSRLDRGIIVTNANSGIREIGQLRGKRIMATSRLSLVGYLAQAKRLKDAGIDPERDVRIILGGGQDEVLVRLLVNAKFDAAFVREQVLQAVKGKVDLARIRIVERTDFYPSWCLTAFRETDSTTVAKVQAALFKLSLENPQHARILGGIGAHGFVPAGPEDFQKVAELVEALRLPL